MPLVKIRLAEKCQIIPTQAQLLQERVDSQPRTGVLSLQQVHLNHPVIERHLKRCVKHTGSQSMLTYVDRDIVLIKPRIRHKDFSHTCYKLTICVELIQIGVDFVRFFCPC
jgi:hypothetical protein